MERVEDPGDAAARPCQRSRAMTVHSYQLFEPEETGPPSAPLPPPPTVVTPIRHAPSAHDHLVQFIREFGADGADGSTDLVLDLTGDEPVVILPAPPLASPPGPAPTNGDPHQTVL